MARHDNCFKLLSSINTLPMVIVHKLFELNTMVCKFKKSYTYEQQYNLHV